MERAREPRYHVGIGDRGLGVSVRLSVRHLGRWKSRKDERRREEKRRATIHPAAIHRLLRGRGCGQRTVNSTLSDPPPLFPLRTFSSRGNRDGQCVYPPTRLPGHASQVGSVLVGQGSQVCGSSEWGARSIGWRDEKRVGCIYIGGKRSADTGL